MPMPSKFTAEVRDRIIERVRRGDSIRTAAARAGITHPTLLRWQEEGKSAPPGSLKAQFLAKLEEAHAEAVGEYSDELRRHALVEHDLKATVFWLERRTKEFAPPAAQRERQAPGMVVIQLALPDGRPVPTSTVMQLPAAEPA